MSSKEECFAEDPHLSGADPKDLRDGCYETGELTSLNFGLFLVAAWRSFPTSLEPSYRVLAGKVASFFASTTGYETGRQESSNEPEAHIYPFADLHMTVATFHTLLDPAPANEKHAAAVKKFCTDVIERSSKRDGWPKETKLRLRPKDLVVGKKNVIILWQETTGNMEAMRHCIKEELESRQESKSAAGMEKALAGGSLFFPNIVHCTFMRFWKGIESFNPDVLRKAVKDIDLLEIFGDEIEVDSNVKLVCEDTPCMHISDDASRILWSED
mmetsp:Transcript_32824/g.55826  ORF Transcript_32824/g.55826 Transcript_32824/m.55826 type:complete len:271 (-) Transcript_32824:277-1089(-)